MIRVIECVLPVARKSSWAACSAAASGPAYSKTNGISAFSPGESRGLPSPSNPGIRWTSKPGPLVTTASTVVTPLISIVAVLSRTTGNTAEKFVGTVPAHTNAAPSHLSVWFTWHPNALRGPAAPVGPCGPVAPCAPATPGIPCGPVAPVAPGAPSTPGAPSAPDAPAAPFAPAGPVAPVAPAAPTAPIVRLNVPLSGVPLPLDTCSKYVPGGNPGLIAVISVRAALTWTPASGSPPRNTTGLEPKFTPAISTEAASADAARITSCDAGPFPSCACEVDPERTSARTRTDEYACLCMRASKPLRGERGVMIAHSRLDLVQHA